MTKSEIIKAIASKKGFDRDTVSKVLEAFTGEIKTALLDGKSVSMRGFGTFYLKHRAEKTARNMQTIPLSSYQSTILLHLSLLRSLPCR